MRRMDECCHRINPLRNEEITQMGSSTSGHVPPEELQPEFSFTTLPSNAAVHVQNANDTRTRRGSAPIGECCQACSECDYRPKGHITRLFIAFDFNVIRLSFH